MRDRRLEPFAVPAGDGVLGLMAPLRAALTGSGPALLLHSAQLHRRGALTPSEDDPDDPTVVVVSTSGSSAAAKGVVLQASALLGSASATHDRLGGPGHWLLALPGHHVAGLQVLIRSMVAGTVPEVLDLSDGFRPDAFAQAANRMTADRRYTALVPTQLARLLDDDTPALARLLARFDAVLVGGAVITPALLNRARRAGVRVVTSYGMTETCGGCVYDGTPLDGVQVALDPTGRISLGGPVVARGYRNGPRFPTDGNGVRWYHSDDAGTVDGAGRLTVIGRLDDAVTTGGVTVSPGPVEAALLLLPGVAEAVVVAAADDEWGQRVVAALVLRPGSAAPSLADARSLVREGLGPAAAPRQLLILDRLPLRGPGKPDRAAIARLAALDPH